MICRNAKDDAEHEISNSAGLPTQAGGGGLEQGTNRV